ncbi:coiled-coil domain-containing protein 9B isoform X2 [Triplophysa dalaica]|nr:coiled-coil domain-containing protein 9B isoform X2 [Triplophysa dalaica]
MMMMMKMQKDAELDKKIKALRKKNEALMKRYQEVEEDKKQAEQEGMSLHSRKGKPNDLTITLNKSPNEKRVVTKKSGEKDSNTRSDQEKDPCESGSRSSLGVGRGKRRQLLVTTPGNIRGKRVFGERKDRNRPVSPARVKPGAEEEQDTPDTSAPVKPPPSTKRIVEIKPLGVTDLTLTSREEETEYQRWKTEREEIDRERVARHRNSKGQWRRAWDVEKPELMFSDKPDEGPDRDAHTIGNRNGRRRNLATEESRARERKGNSRPVVSSKAKGKERLTGRARRWDAKEHEGHEQVYPEGDLQAFLEELDALCSSEEKNIHQDDVPNSKPHVSEAAFRPENFSGDVISDEETAGLKTTEKEVGFSDELLEMPQEISDSGSQPQNGSEERHVAEDKEMADMKGEEMKRLSDVSVINEESREAWCLGSRSGHEDVCVADKPVQTLPLELNKTCCEEGMESSLCVLNVDSEDALSDCSSSVDVARENGKVV